MATKPINFKHHRNRALRVAVFSRDGFRCRHCGWQASTVPEDYDGRYAIGAWPHHDERILHIDHVVPRHLDGPSELDNLQTLCESCNCRKSGRI